MALAAAFRSHGPRVLAALAARYRDLDLAEEAVAEACARAAALWPVQGPPNDPAAWLYRVADRAALQALRRRATRQRLQPDPPPPEPTACSSRPTTARRMLSSTAHRRCRRRTSVS